MPGNSRIAVLVALAALVSVPAGAVTPRRLPLLGPAEAAGGTAAGVAVVEPSTLRLAPRVREIPLRTERSQPQPFVWSLAADSLGRVYAGTGNEGIVFRVSPSGGVEEFFRAEEIEVTALAVDARDRVYVGACPPARIYRVDPDGAASLLVETEEPYLWALAFDSRGNLVAATGDRGILYRIAEDGEERVLVDSDEPHIVSLASGPDGTMFAGTAGRGLVYRIPPSGEPQILYESGTEEVSALARTADGTLFAALLEAVPEEKPRRGDGRRERESPPEEAPEEWFPLRPGEETIPGVPASGPAVPREARGRARRLRTRLVAVSPEGRVRTLWRNEEELIYALAPVQDEVTAGTGRGPGGSREPEEEGDDPEPSVEAPGGVVRRFSLGDDPVLLARLGEAQVSGLLPLPGGGLFAATSNLGTLYWVEADPVESGTFTSAPVDAGGTARWGRLWWQGEAPDQTRVEVRTRSGESARPDEAWSPWESAVPDDDGYRVVSPAGRFLQWQLELRPSPRGESPRVQEVWLSLLHRNEPPTVRNVRIETAGSSPKEGPSRPEGRILLWEWEDPNGDEPAFAVEVRRAGEDAWRRIAEGLRAGPFPWDPEGLADGRYQVRVFADDSGSNPAGEGLAGEARSAFLIVDGTPPEISASAPDRPRAGGGIDVEVNDNLSGVATIRSAWNGGEWVPVFPADGIADSRRERARVAIPGLPPGEHTLRLEAADGSGNRSIETLVFTLMP